MTDQLVPIAHENCVQVRALFYHGTKAKLLVGDTMKNEHLSHFEGRALQHVYFSAPRTSDPLKIVEIILSSNKSWRPL